MIQLHWYYLLAAAMTAPLFSSVPAPDEKPSGPKFSYRIKKAGEDTIRATPEKDGYRFHVTSKTGIGAAEIILEEGTWPSRMNLDLALWNLEHFAVGNGNIVLKGRLQNGADTVLHYDKEGQPVADASQAIFTLKIARRGKNLIEVTLPTDFAAKKSKKLEFDWIDAYR